MIDHFGLQVSDYDQARAFYAKALAPLGYTVVMEFADSTAGFGLDGKPDFWIYAGGRTSPPVHVAFRAETRAIVDAFYAAALSAGATDNGAPGLRLDYHPNYYGAFVRDGDGHNIEAVCHTQAS
ncbi:VOC family protein [Chelatococcus asaccharovorans]|uniref:Catechol 2,3-dioxygenase-like lactoylglutathione lyase family enzyme n=1 Tax=Chelatococcus asaccharovorans TaxID=28210 RepID=A0A2V3UIW8_9HYPH|nr:VOC family protein [Chelatococcus asaccharovorans]MBS7706385.1 VOC family protein [Chelatococcus asaccharovorans]PXW64973.1 catechol 2,3-dioxygenase-like lactoylglutathione lyase family enzyme [Chelatococcus asaccharovorans]